MSFSNFSFSTKKEITGLQEVMFSLFTENDNNNRTIALGRTLTNTFIP